MNSTAPRPRRRWLRRLLILAVLFALLFALAPTLSAPLVRARLEAALTERTGGEVTLESLSLSWPGSATLEGLVLRGPDGDEHARVGRAHASVGLLAALRGRYLAQVEVEDWFARAERRPDGSWSLEELIKGDEARGGDPESPQSTEPPQASEPPFVQARVQLSDGTLELHDGDQTATCTLGRVCLDLVGLDRPAPFEVAGDLTAAGPYALGAGTLSLSGELTIEPELVVDAALEVAGRSLRAPGEVAEETVELSTALEFDGASVAVAELHLESSIVSGDLKGRLEGIAGEELALRGVQGDLTYLPDALGKLLAPHLPGELSGAEPERLEITFDGPLASFSLDDLLSGCEGRSHLGLGLFSAYGIEARGGLGVDVGEGRLQLDGQLEAAGGALNLGASYSQDGARLSLALDGARASAQLAPLLGELHPVFAGLDQIEGASLEGALTAELELSVDGPVSLTGLTEGFDLSRVRGRGSLALDQGRLRGSPLLSELLTALGEPAETALELAPMSFTLGGDRLDYAERWRWAIDGVDTWFTALNKFVEARDMFVCPTRPERNGFYYLNIGYAYNYCYMTYVCIPETGNFAASFNNYSRGIKLDMLERPGETIVITDSNLHDFDGNPQYYVGWQPNMALWDPMIVPETRHFDVADILFADGHVGELGDEAFHDPTLWDRK